MSETIDVNGEVIRSADAYLVGKKLVSVTLSDDGEYLRWTFEGGGYVEWYSGVPRREGRM